MKITAIETYRQHGFKPHRPWLFGAIRTDETHRVQRVRQRGHHTRLVGLVQISAPA